MAVSSQKENPRTFFRESSFGLGALNFFCGAYPISFIILTKRLRKGPTKLESILPGAIGVAAGEGNRGVGWLHGVVLRFFGVSRFRFGRGPVGGGGRTDPAADGQGAVAAAQRPDGSGALPVGAGSRGGDAGGGLGASSPGGLAEEAVTGHGDGADDKDADKPDHHSHEDGDDLEQGIAGDDGIAEGLVVEDGDGNTPPGEHGIHQGSQHPGTEEVPDFGGFVGTLLRGEEAGDASEVDAAEGDGEDGSPADADELEITEQVREGEVGGGVIEEFEGQESADDEAAEEQAALDLDTGIDKGDGIQHDKPPEKGKVGGTQ